MVIGDTVVRKSYDKDITFKIIDIKEVDGKLVYILKGISIRIIADSPETDLEPVDVDFVGEKEKILNSRVNDAIKKAVNTRSENSSKNNCKNGPILLSRGSKSQKNTPNKDLMFGRPGKILHIDGDRDYLETCLKVYKQLSLDAVGRAILEKEQANQVVDLVKEIKPDIVVLTGHDSVLKESNDYLDLNNYRNSNNFLKAVKEARKWQPDLDTLVIFAGACQSNYEALMKGGANYASSPGRIMIHALDPVFIVEKIACSRIDVVVPIEEILDQTITGVKGIGGFETRGKFRWAMPKPLL